MIADLRDDAPHSPTDNWVKLLERQYVLFGLANIQAIGIDPSLTATGWATNQHIGVIKGEKPGTDPTILQRDRIDRLVAHTVATVLPDGAYIAIETPYIAHATASAIRTVGLHYQLRHRLTEAGARRIIDVTPATLKKYATGNGNASKKLMVAAAEKHLAYGGDDNNVADALWLRQVALHAVMQDGGVTYPEPLPDIQTAALHALFEKGTP